jgi:cytochrome P450
LISPFIEEALRLESPAQEIIGDALRIQYWVEQKFQKDATLTLLWGSANRDESVLNRPINLFWVELI